MPANTTNPSSKSTNLKLGVGLQYAFTDRLSVRGELERYRIEDPVRNKGSINMASVGLVYRFGDKPRAAVAQTAYVPPPVYVAPAPAPAPAPAAVYIAPPPPPVAYVAPAAAPAPVYVAPDRPAKLGRN